MFAIVTISGNQYTIHQGDVIAVNQISGKTGETVTFDRVLLVHDEKKTFVGRPTLKKWVVTAKILGHEKGKKIDVARFKSKVRYRRAKGFRPRLTKLEIIKITTA